MAALLLVAIFTVHLPYGFSSIKLMAVTAAGAQFGRRAMNVTLYLACLAALVLVARDMGYRWTPQKKQADVEAQAPPRLDAS